MTEEQAKELARAFVLEHVQLDVPDDRPRLYGVGEEELILVCTFLLGSLQIGRSQCLAVSPTGEVRCVGSVGE